MASRMKFCSRRILQLPFLVSDGKKSCWTLLICAILVPQQASGAGSMPALREHCLHRRGIGRSASLSTDWSVVICRGTDPFPQILIPLSKMSTTANFIDCSIRALGYPADTMTRGVAKGWPNLRELRLCFTSHLILLPLKAQGLPYLR